MLCRMLRGVSFILDAVETVKVLFFIFEVSGMIESLS